MNMRNAKQLKVGDEVTASKIAITKPVTITAIEEDADEAVWCTGSETRSSMLIPGGSGGGQRGFGRNTHSAPG